MPVMEVLPAAFSSKSIALFFSPLRSEFVSLLTLSAVLSQLQAPILKAITKLVSFSKQEGENLLRPYDKSSMMFLFLGIKFREFLMYILVTLET